MLHDNRSLAAADANIRHGLYIIFMLQIHKVRERDKNKMEKGLTEHGHQ